MDAPSFWMFLVDVLPHILQNLLVVMLGNHLVERNKFLMMNALTVKINHQHILDI
jgi:hypothetical protein